MKEPTMKAALFNSTNYLGPMSTDVWPAPVDTYSTEIAEHTLANALSQFRLADDVGFDWVTVAEHHYGPFSLTPSPTVIAGALSQIVRNAKIALLGPNISIQNPIRVAEEIAMLDTLTGGRIVVGMVRGTPNEYVTYNVNPAESRGRFEEALQIMRAAWTQPQPFGWQGRHFEYRSISIWPRPVQQPHPPLYMSGSSPESSEFAARNHVGIAFAVTTVQRAAKAAEHYRRHAAEAGWIPTADDVIFRLAFHVADTDDQALEDLKAPGAIRRGTNVAFANAAVESAVAEAGYYGRDIETQRGRNLGRAQQTDEQIRGRIERGQLLVGSPETVVSQIRRIRDQLDAGILDLSIAIQHGDATTRSIELFGTKVLPSIRQL